MKDPKQPTDRAVVYCRISKDTESTGLGVERQRRACAELCDREHLQVLDVYVDNDISAYSGKRRPGYEDMCARVRSGEIDVVVAWHPDRLTRQPRELEDLIDLLESTKTKVRTVQAGEYDLSTPSGRTTARVVGAVARGESEHKSARLRLKHEELAREGRPTGGGHRPFGFEMDRVTVRSSEADLVSEAADRVLAGESLRSLCRWLESVGSTTTAGNHWAPHSLRRVLLSPRIAGRREHRGTDSEAVWPALVDPRRHRRLVQLLSDPARKKNNGRERRLLTGLLCCGLCETRMVSRPKQTKDGPSPSYVCASGPGYGGCGKMRIQGEPLDGAVTQAVIERVDGEGLRNALEGRDDDDLADVDDELADIEAKRAELGADYADGEISRDTLKAVDGRLQQREEEIRRRLGHRARNERASRLPEGPLAEAWNDLPLEQRRAIVASVVERVDVASAVRGRNFFDRDRYSITWRA